MLRSFVPQKAGTVSNVTHRREKFILLGDLKITME